MFGTKFRLVKKKLPLGHGGMTVTGMTVWGWGGSVDKILVIDVCVTVYVDLDQVLPLAKKE